MCLCVNGGVQGDGEVTGILQIARDTDVPETELHTHAAHQQQLRVKESDVFTSNHKHSLLVVIRSRT